MIVCRPNPKLCSIPPTLDLTETVSIARYRRVGHTAGRTGCGLGDDSEVHRFQGVCPPGQCGIAFLLEALPNTGRVRKHCKTRTWERGVGVGGCGIGAHLRSSSSLIPTWSMRPSTLPSRISPIRSSSTSAMATFNCWCRDSEMSTMDRLVGGVAATVPLPRRKAPNGCMA